MPPLIMREPPSPPAQVGPGFRYACATVITVVAVVGTAHLQRTTIVPGYFLLLGATLVTSLIVGLYPALLSALIGTLSGVFVVLHPSNPTAEGFRFAGYIGIECLVLLGAWETQKRKLAQIELQRQQDSLAFALESSKAYSWEWDIVSGLVSRSAMASSHLPAPHVVLESLDAALARIHADDRERVREAMQHAAHGGGNLDQIFRVPLAGGHLRWANARGQAIVDAAGRPVRLLGITVDVTEHQQARETSEALLRRTQQLELASEAALVGSFEWDLRSGERFQSPELPKVYGLDPGKVIDLASWAQYLVPVDRERVLQATDRLLKQREAFDQTYRIVDPAGTEHVIRTIARPLDDSEGTLARIVGVSADVTVSFRAREITEQYANIVEHSDDAVYAWDLQGTIMNWNPGAERMFGYTHAEIVGQPVTLMMEDPSVLQPLIAAARNNLPMRHLETIRIAKDGRRVVLSSTISPLRSSEGAVIGASVIARDITERKYVEQRFRALVENSIDGIALLDEQGKIVYISSSAEKITGYAPADIVGKYFNDFSVKREQVMIAKAFQQALANPEKPITIEAGAILRDVERRFRVTLNNRLADPVVGAVVLNFSDITREKQAEETLRTTEKLAAMGRLAATIAHEINNPLESVSNVLYLLERQTELTDSSKRFVNIATEELKRIAHIVKHTLGFYRESESAVSVELADTVESVREMLGRRFRTGVAMERRFDDRGTIMGFPGELRQVVSNLVVNAFEAVREDGRVLVHITAGRNWKTGENGVCLVVADNGPGIPSEARNQVFQPFFTTKGERGTGLGLWVSQGIVTKHQGAIRLRTSTLPHRHGTAFKLWFPAAAHREESESAHRAKQLA